MLRQLIGYCAVVLSLAGLIPYIVSILKRRTIPHAFTWLIWTSMTWIAFLAQVSDNAGPGAWATGVTAVVCLVILTLSAFYGERDIRRLDWISLVAAGIAGALWAITNSALTAVILITVIDAIGFVPTLRKIWHKPNSEAPLNYYLSAMKHGISIPALNNLSMITVFYPAVVGLMNLVAIAFVVVRQRATAIDIERPVVLSSP
jgi:hypothetical protein